MSEKERPSWASESLTIDINERMSKRLREISVERKRSIESLAREVLARYQEA